MKTYYSVVLCALLALPTLCLGQSVQPKTISKKNSTTSTKSTNSAPKPVEQTPKNIYAELTINELIAEDANR